MKIREYEVLGKIGQPGGMAVVFKAKHQSLEVIRAIKKLHFHLVSSTSILQRFENEAKALSILEHPNIVKVYDFFREEDNYYLIMEYIDGSSLAEVLKKSPLKEKVALNYLKQILSTMAFAHSKKILHRDIKPSNILISSKYEVKVVDFGIAKMMDRKGVTSTGFTMGSPWYMSPEQIIGHKLDERSDIYSLGITLFEMLTAKVPFDDTSEYKIYEKHQKEKIPLLKEINKKLSSDLDAIIQKATAKKPEERFQSALQFAEAVDIYMALTELGGGGSTIADFDPTEYMKDQKAEKGSDVVIDLPTKFMELTSIAEITEADQKADTKKAAVQKKTTYQGATVFQGEDDTIAPRTTKDLIQKKKIAGLPKQKRKILSKFLIFAGSGAALILILYYLLFQADLSPEPLNVAQGNISYSSIQFSWPEIPTADHYQISKKPVDESTFQPITKISTAVFEDTTLNPGQGYDYQITAHEKDGKIIAVGEISAKTRSVDLGLMADLVTAAEVSLAWNQVENIDTYILYRQEADSKSFDDFKEVYRGQAIEYTDKKLKPEQSYAYMLKVEFKNRSEFESRVLDVKTEEKTKAALAFGELQVNSNPEGATVFMNGQELGSTPFKRKGLGTGKYKIEVKKEGFSDFSETVRIRANRATKVSPDMVSLSGELAILVKPYGSILIDGELLTKDTPVQYSTKLPAGKHKVTIVHTGLGARWEKRIEINGGKSHNIQVDFTKMVTLNVSSEPAGMIIVDGKPTGEMTPKQIEVRVGQHGIGVRLEGYEMVGGSKNINFEENLEKPLKFVLQKKK
jgi:serine/threonine protein kinase